VTYLRRAIREAKGLSNANLLLDGGVEKRSVDIKLTQLKVTGGHDGEEEAKACHADDGEERFRIVEANALAATFGDEPCFKAGDISHCV
jgi:hypothetical protein